METSAKKRVIIFIALTFALTWGLLLFAFLTGMSYGDPNMIIILTACMFMPALCSLMTRLITQEGFRDMMLRPRIKGNVGRYFIAAYLPVGIILLGGALYFLCFPDTLDIHASALVASLLSSGVPVSQLQLAAIGPIILFVITAPIVNLIPTLGEELGWRAYLLPHLEGLGERKALLLTGLIWGLWHAPMIAMGHNYGTEYFGSPYLGILLMTLFCIAMGCFEGYLVLRVKSVWPAALSHSTINAISGLPLYVCLQNRVLLGPTMTGILSMLPLIAIGIICFMNANKKAVE